MTHYILGHFSNIDNFKVSSKFALQCPRPRRQLSYFEPLLVGNNHCTPHKTCCFGDALTQSSSYHDLSESLFKVNSCFLYLRVHASPRDVKIVIHTSLHGFVQTVQTVHTTIAYMVLINTFIIHHCKNCSWSSLCWTLKVLWFIHAFQWWSWNTKFSRNPVLCPPTMLNTMLHIFLRPMPGAMSVSRSTRTQCSMNITAYASTVRFENPY